MTAVKDFWIRRHVRNCPYCQRKLAGRKEIRRILMHENDLRDIKDIWPRIRSRLDQKPAPQTRKERPSPAFKFAGLLAAVIIGIGIYFGLFTGSSGEKETSFRIHHIKVRNRPADVYYYQPQDSDMVLIWAEDSLESGG